MATIPEALNAAVKHHQAGQLAQAEQIYRQVLAVDPRQFDAWHLLGLTLHQQGQSDAAIQHIREALRLKPDFPEAHYNLGNVLRDLQRPAEAAACYQQALRWRPDSAETHYNLGNALNDLHQYAAGRRKLSSRPLRLKPNYQKALNNLGNCYMDLERHAEAADVLSASARVIVPAMPRGTPTWATPCGSWGDRMKSVAACRRALELEPNNAEAQNNLAAALLDQGQTGRRRWRPSIESIELRPDYAEARMNRGMAWLHVRRLRPRLGGIRMALAEQGLRAARLFAAAVGRLAAGRPHDPVHAEQGLGDTLQFLRYVPDVKQRGGTVLLECSPRAAQACWRSLPASIGSWRLATNCLPSMCTSRC